MAKETKHEALMMLQVLGSGHPTTIFSDRVEVGKTDPINEVAERAYQKLKEKLPKKEGKK